jgi:hypothetical protein
MVRTRLSAATRILRIAEQRLIPGGLTREESAAVVKKDYESFAAAIKAAGIEPPK